MQQAIRDTDQTQETAPAGTAGVWGWLRQRGGPAQTGRRAAYGVLCDIALWIISPEQTSPPARASSDWLIP